MNHDSQELNISFSFAACMFIVVPEKVILCYKFWAYLVAI
jgi:hypothetical protein